MKHTLVDCSKPFSTQVTTVTLTSKEQKDFINLKQELEISNAIAIKAKMLSELKEEADPLMAQYLAGEIEKEVWLAKRTEIKERIPKPQIME